jgi:hypothetical protein
MVFGGSSSFWLDVFSLRVADMVAVMVQVLTAMVVVRW